MNTLNNSVAVRVPASSANIGPGFDVLGMALSLHLEAGFGSSPADSVEATANHPTLVAFNTLWAWISCMVITKNIL